MTPEERKRRSDAFLRGLKRLMQKHEIATIRVFDEQFCGFHQDGAGIFECGRIDSYSGKEFANHNKLNTTWKVYGEVAESVK